MKVFKSTRSYFQSIVAVSAAVIVYAQPAMSYDLKDWSGSTCQAFFGSQEGNFNKTWSGIENIGSSAQWVMCGITRDSYTNALGTQGAAVWVRAPATATTTCYMSERNGTDGSEVDTTTNSRLGNGFMDLDTSSSANLAGNRIVACKLPPQGKLVQIRAWEPDKTDDND